MYTIKDYNYDSETYEIVFEGNKTETEKFLNKIAEEEVLSRLDLLDIFEIYEDDVRIEFLETTIHLP